MSACRSCGAEIWWAHTTAGRLIPLDVTPVADGNVVTTGRQSVVSYPSGKPQARVEVEVDGGPGMFPDERPRYHAHFATCPNADEWRKR